MPRFWQKVKDTTAVFETTNSTGNPVYITGRQPLDVSDIDATFIRAAFPPNSKTYEGTWPPTDVTQPASALTAWNLPNGLAMAHRIGGANLRPENAQGTITEMAALPHTLVDGGDLWMTSDNQVVAMHDATVDRTTNGTGTVSAMTLAAIQALNIDVPSEFGYGVAHPASFAQILTEAAATGVVFTPEFKISSAVVPATDAVVAAGLQNKCIMQSFTLSDLDYPRAAGIRTLLLASASAPSLASMQASGVSILGYDYAQPANFTPAYLQSVYDAGIELSPWIINRRYDVLAEQARISRPVLFTGSNDARWTQGTTPILTSDPYATGKWPSGVLPSAANGGIKGTIASPGKYQFTSTGDLWMLQGWGRITNSVKTTITFDQLATSTTRWAGIGFGQATDGSFNDGSTTIEGGYVAFLRENGNVEIWKRTPSPGSTSTQVGAAVNTGATLTAGTTIDLKVEFIGSTVKATVTRAGSNYSTQGIDTTYRGPYFHIGKSDLAATPALLASFSNITTT